jgi:hypothetical protein
LVRRAEGALRLDAGGALRLDAGGALGLDAGGAARKGKRIMLF